MSSDNTRIEMTATPRDAEQMDLNALEQIFGTPKSPTQVTIPATHTVTSEKNNGNGPLRNNNNNHQKIEDVELLPATQPLLEADRGRNQPPLTGPEVDDLNDQVAHPQQGIDDGLLEPGDRKTEAGANGAKEGEDHPVDGLHGEGPGTEDGKWPWHDDELDHPHDIRFDLGDRAGTPVLTIIPDVNTYQQKKNLAQGMMDLALLSANANQLRYVLESSSSGHPYYYSSITFITFSILLQIAVGVGLILNSRYNVKDEKDICKADKINNMTVLGIFLITIVNVFVASFSVAPSNAAVATLPVVQQAG